MSENNRVNPRNLVMNKPPENLFSKGLADIDYNVLVGSIVLAVIYQEGGVTPVIGVLLRWERDAQGADGARRRGRPEEAPRVGERAGAAGAQEDDRRRRRRRRQSSVSGGRLHRWLDKLFAALLLRNGEDFVLGWCDLCIYIENASNFLAMLLSSFLLLIFEI